MRITKFAPSGVVFLSAVLSLSGCASILHGSGQEVGIASTPPGAKVQIDGKNIGTTPLVKNLARGETHQVLINKQGYQPYSATFTNNLSGWVWGNLVFGGFIGVAVDAGTGGMYKLSPKNITATLVPYRQTASRRQISPRVPRRSPVRRAWIHN